VFLLSPPQDVWIESNIGYDCDSSSPELTPCMLLISCNNSLVWCLALMCYKVSSPPWPNNETDLSSVCTSCFGLQNLLCQHPHAKNLDSFHITFRCQEFRPHCLATMSVSRMDSWEYDDFLNALFMVFVQPTYIYIHLLKIQTVRVLLPRQSTGHGVWVIWPVHCH